MSNFDKQNPQLLEKYCNLLDQDSKTIIQLIALIGYDADTRLLIACLRNESILNSENLFFTDDAIARALKSLERIGLIDCSVRRSTHCNPSIFHAVLKDAVKQKKLIAILNDLAEEENSENYYHQYEDSSIQRDLRLFIYQNKHFDLNAYCDTHRVTNRHIVSSMWHYIISNIPFDQEWLRSLSSEWQNAIIAYFCQNAFFNMEASDDLVKFIVENKKNINTAHDLLAEHHLLKGEFDKFSEHLSKSSDPYTKSILTADFLFCQNRLEEAVLEYSRALQMLRKTTKRSKAFLSSYHVMFYILADISCHGTEHARAIVERSTGYEMYGVDWQLLSKLLSKLDGHEISVYPHVLSEVAKEMDVNGVSSLLLLFWLAPKMLKNDLMIPIAFFNKAATNGYKILAKICAEIITGLGANPLSTEYLEQNNDSIKVKFLDLVKIKPLWEIKLEQILGVSGQLSSNNSMLDQTQKEMRLVWLFNTSKHASSSDLLKPAEQEKKQNGGWKLPREIQLKCFYENPPRYMSLQDQKIYGTLVKRDYYYQWNIPVTLQALIGHSLIYEMGNKGNKIDLVEENVHLLVEEKGDNFTIKLSHYSDKIESLLIKDNSHCYKVVKYDSSLLKLANVLGRSGITVPLESKDKILDVIGKLSDNIAIHSTVEAAEIPIILASSKIEVQLIPYDKGLEVNIAVRPLEGFGSCMFVGIGSKVIISAYQGRKVQIIRNLAEEKSNLNYLIKNCKILQNKLQDSQAIIEAPLECLKLLSELKVMEDEITIVWPRGEMKQVKANLSFGNLKMKVRQNQDWFAVDGDVIVDGKKLMSIKELLDLIDYNDNPFIPLSTDKFISLSEHFKKQLQRLKNTAIRDENGYQIHKLATFAVDEVIGECKNIELAHGWNEPIKKLSSNHESNETIPSDFKAILRPYQKEGCSWLSKMASLDMGACLADDMGLGKTIQAIASLLTHAENGPSLIVAPTSVCYNWVEEIKKFAPTLKSHLFAELDRETLLRNVAAKDVVICSYGLLQRTIGLMREIDWQMVVLDEAQAIKNSSAKRSQAAYQLKGKFRLALTGTPIENHLNELWSLFRFLNPGFMGSEQSFFKRFIIPIEQYKNENARDTLKKLIKPFMLRRLKSSVLQELPPKTELTLMFDLSAEERVFYEALRAKVIEEVESAGDSMQEGEKCFKILAGITKLRLACCHSTLVYSEIDLPSSKLGQFSYLLNDILENNHRVLVFSQFVRYLNIVKKLLDEKKVSYQYLDGQTPQKQRKKIINNFQNGNDEVFLLSLKAGGVGLNLTAADYVILLDPWWNPAVENQATDRAHRIGQTKPVTIYRLIGRQTIEEKILELHKTKKGLAEGLLSDSDISCKLSTTELLKMIANTNL